MVSSFFYVGVSRLFRSFLRYKNYLKFLLYISSGIFYYEDRKFPEGKNTRILFFAYKVSLGQKNLHYKLP